MDIIRVLDHVDSCSTTADGEIIFSVLKPLIEKGSSVVVSFDGIGAVPSSFINSAFIPFISLIGFERVKTTLSFTNSNRHINETIKRRFEFEAKRIAH